MEEDPTNTTTTTAEAPVETTAPATNETATQEAATAVEAESAPAASAAPQSKSIFGPGASGATPQDWLDKLPEELKTNANLRKFKSVEEALKGYVNMAALVGRKGLELPADEKDEAAMEAYFNARRGGVEAPESYTKKYSAHDLAGLDKETFDTASAYMFANGFSDREHGKMMDLIAGIREREAELWEAKNQENYDRCVRDLQHEWGNEYEANLSRVQNFMKNFPQAQELLRSYGLENHIDVVRMLHAAARGVSQATAPKSAEVVESAQDVLRQIDNLFDSNAYKNRNSAGNAEAKKQMNMLLQKKARLRAEGRL